jgi:type II secretory pathway component PulJ
MKRHSPRSRSGWTLLEILVVLPLMALLLSGSAMLLTALFRSQGALSSDIQQESTRSRLAAQFRADAHWSISARCESGKECVFTGDDNQTVHYSVQETTILREERLGPEVTMRERYPLDGIAGEFSLEPSTALTLVHLDLKPVGEPTKYASASRLSHLEAAVGSLRGGKSVGGQQP